MKLILSLFLPFLAYSQTLEKRFQTLIDSVYMANQDAIGIIVHVESPDFDFSWTYTVGHHDRYRNKTLYVEQPHLLASNTKPYVSAAILKLVEERKFTLDTGIKKLIGEEYASLFESDGYDLDKITVKHLLSHTSGIHDHVDDEYFDNILLNPSRKWTKDEQIRRAVEIGEPISDPGTTFTYADINYLLLTEIIELQIGKPFYLAMRELLKFNKLGLNNTWFETLEARPKDFVPFAHQYAKDFKYDSYAINPSWDLYGGGGLASTAKDAALFFQNLFTG